MNNINFVAIDFETATSAYTACQLGIVIVRAGEIVDEKCFLIQPPENKYNPYNIKIHGIRPEQTKNVPTFGELWSEIKPYLEKQVIVHHSDGFDRMVLDRSLEYYGLESCRYIAEVSTMFLFPQEYSRSLSNLCNAYDIEMLNHHDALSDARNCAQLFIKYLKGEDPNYNLLPKKQVKVRDEDFSGYSMDRVTIDRVGDALDRTQTDIANGTLIIEIEGENQKLKKTIDYNSDEFQKRKIKSETLVQDLESVENKDTLFYDKKIVISGVFERYPIRNDLAKQLKDYGADINTALSKQTNIFIVGAKSGPAKNKQALKIQEDGFPLRIISEDELYKILDNLK